MSCQTKDQVIDGGLKEIHALLSPVHFITLIMLLALNVEIQYEIATGYVYGPISTTVISCVLLNDTLNRCLEQLQY